MTMAESLPEMDFVDAYIEEAREILDRINIKGVHELAHSIGQVREQKGRLFILGLGGSASHASHAAADFRKLCEVDAYAPVDNVAELTARINDDGWIPCLSDALIERHLVGKDAVLFLSVGGGRMERPGGVGGVSAPLVAAADHTRYKRAHLFGILGRDGGELARMCDPCVRIPNLYPDRVTPHTEGTMSVLLHLLCTHPALARNKTKW